MDHAGKKEQNGKDCHICYTSGKGAKDGATTQEIKAKVLSMLKSKNPEWERNWMVYDTAVKKRAG
jgi:hypothetical protein